MSTAVELLDQGYEVDIYEQRPFIGGKVASYRDRDGNHIEMGYELLYQLYGTCSCFFPGCFTCILPLLNFPAQFYLHSLV